MPGSAIAAGDRRRGRWAAPARVAAVLGLLLAVAFVGPGAALAARVVTKRGAEFVGTIVRREAGRLVLRTEGGGQVTIAEDDIEHIERAEAEGKETRPAIRPVEVAPGRARAAFQEAEEAMKARQWQRAGGLWAGLLALDPRVLEPAQARRAAEALAICHLQLRDLPGAAVALRRRAALAGRDAAERERVLAVIEALQDRKEGGPAARPPTSFEALLEAGCRWKADQLAAQARRIAENPTLASVRGRLQRTAQRCLDLLDEADRLVPGTAGRHREAVLRTLAGKVIEVARRTADRLAGQREWLNKNRWRSWAEKSIVKAWTAKVVAYLSARRQAADALSNLLATPLLAGCYDKRQVLNLLGRLDELQYYPGSKLRIAPRKTGQ